jgi:Cd2+/Zn2+-exporting ATPase
MAVLVAASPCALAIATPSAVLSAIARAGRDGVLIKGGGPLEQLGRVTAVAFDKTGTLTTGRPEVVDVVSMPRVSREEVISVASAVQRLSDHPLARAIVRADDESGHQDLRNHKALNHGTEVERIAGQGVVAHIDGERVAVGNAKLFQGSVPGGGVMPSEIASAESELRANGRTIAIVRRGEQYLGVIGIVDTPRPVAKQVIDDLRQIGMRQLVMLSGDHQEAAQSIARELGLDDARGDLLPEEKVAEVSKLSQTHVTAMVGDGANDAPAMAAASVSIAMGAAGSDVALETADIALMGDDLAKLPFAIALAQASNRITRQNLWISLGTIAFLLPATILGFRLGAAVVLHEGSTLVVVANALRLLRFRSPKSTLPVA